jgi:hypothetical protein
MNEEQKKRQRIEANESLKKDFMKKPDTPKSEEKKKPSSEKYGAGGYGRA